MLQQEAFQNSILLSHLFEQLRERRLPFHASRPG